MSKCKLALNAILVLLLFLPFAGAFALHLSRQAAAVRIEDGLLDDLLVDPPAGTPRLGTISPWASKATDILHNCGIDIRRVERVTEYVLTAGEQIGRAHV